MPIFLKTNLRGHRNLVIILQLGTLESKTFVLSDIETTHLLRCSFVKRLNRAGENG